MMPLTEAEANVLWTIIIIAAIVVVAYLWGNR